MADFNPDAYLASKSAAAPNQAFDPDAYLKAKMEPPPESAPEMSQSEAAALLAPRALTFGLAPVAAGAGAAAGAFTGTKGDIFGKLNAAKEAYSEGKSERLSKQNEAASKFPKTALISDVAGTLATAPLMGASTVAGAATKGALGGAAVGLGEGDSVSDVGKGALAGGLISGGVQSASPYISKGLDYVGGKIGSGAKKVASTLSGLPEEEIKNYASKTDEINKIIKKSGGAMPEAIDAERMGLLNDVSSYRQVANKNIGDVLEKSSDKLMPVAPVVDKLTAFKSKLDPSLQGDIVNQIDDVINNFTKATKDGNVTPRQMNIIRDQLQDIAASGGAYKNRQGAIVGFNKELGNAAKQAAAIARKNINAEFPEMAKAYNQLSELYTIQNNLGRGLLKEGANTTSLMNTAAGDNNKSRWLQKLADVSGSPAVSNLKDLKTAQTFNNPDLLSSYKTGRSLLGMGIGGGIGALLDEGDRKEGALIGSALASPLAIKGLINAKNQSGKLLQSLPPGLLQNAMKNYGIQKANRK